MFFLGGAGGERGGRGREKEIEKAAHGHVVYAVQEVSKTTSKGPKRAAIVPEMSVVP